MLGRYFRYLVTISIVFELREYSTCHKYCERIVNTISGLHAQAFQQMKQLAGVAVRRSYGKLKLTHGNLSGCGIGVTSYLYGVECT
jgi:hypothetical protein